MNKKGFTLLELLLVLIFLIFIFLLSIPLVLKIINQSKLKAFQSSAHSVIDSVELYVADQKFIEIPKNGIDIHELDIKIKNNRFDSGIVKMNEHNKLELVYLIQENYCAMGTKENLKVSDKGCGALDETPPIKATIYRKNATKDTITIVASGVDLESKIINYEFRIDGGEYIKNEDDSNIYTFHDLTSGVHTFQVRITNEAGLKIESEILSFKTQNTENILCKEKNQLEGVQTKKKLNCTYPVSNKYIYQISKDKKNWENISLNSGSYDFEIIENQKIYTRVLEGDNTIASNMIQIENIDLELNGALPELLDNMIPVIYDNQKKTWVKADIRKPYWDYSNQIWANAVVVRKNKNIEDDASKSRDYYLSNEAILEPIYEKDIIAYYVWIPRYKYQLWNVTGVENTPAPIQLEFESKNQLETGKVEDAFRNSEWYTHPAFTYENQQLSGFWVSKYKNSAPVTSACYQNPNNNNCNTQVDVQLYSLPETKGITNISASVAFLVASNMKKKSNIYGFTENTNPHVLLNTEWGAITYLTHSKFGKYPSESTTGNITGVFDMEGNYFELVMANYNKDAGNNEEDHSGFKNYGTVDWPEKNINYYKGITSKSRILGDATEETKNWYGSVSNFVNGTSPFMIRGGIIEQKKSMFHYTNSSGSPKENISFRTSIFKVNLDE